MSKQTVEKLRKEFLKENLNIRRYVWIRYTIALMFFANLYWFLMLRMVGNYSLIWPIFLMVLSGMSLIEQVRTLKLPNPKLTATKRYLLTQGLTNTLLIILSTNSNIRENLFPFIHHSKKAYWFLVFWNFVGLVLLLISYRSLLRLIKENKKMNINKE